MTSQHGNVTNISEVSFLTSCKNLAFHLRKFAMWDKLFFILMSIQCVQCKEKIHADKLAGAERVKLFATKCIHYMNDY